MKAEIGVGNSGGVHSSRVSDCDACAWSQAADVDSPREVASTRTRSNVAYVAELASALTVGRDMPGLG